jgi:cyclopropane-fatty-acyl-phospholipid synthase
MWMLVALSALSPLSACGQDRAAPQPTARVAPLPPRVPGPDRWATEIASAEAAVRRGDIGFAESWISGDWQTDSLPALLKLLLANRDVIDRAIYGHWWGQALYRIKHLLNRNSKAGSRRNIHAHYDLGNPFYAVWLDPTMTYSAALFESPDQALEAAQVAKYDRLCRQLRLKPGHEVLEIGSGWGGFTSHAVRNYGCRVTTVTLSIEQQKFAQARFEREGIAHKAEVLLLDYRKLPSLGRRFDRIASIEMLEAVGDSFLETYFRVCQSLLWPGGLFAAQFITCPDSRYDELRRGVDWIQKHVFPGSLLLSLNRVNTELTRAGGFVLHAVDDFGPDYARTLRVWHDNFRARLEQVQALGFDERFIRKWSYYLSYCEAAFALRNISVVHTLHTRANNLSL